VLHPALIDHRPGVPNQSPDAVIRNLGAVDVVAALPLTETRLLGFCVCPCGAGRHKDGNNQECAGQDATPASSGVGALYAAVRFAWARHVSTMASWVQCPQRQHEPGSSSQALGHQHATARVGSPIFGGRWFADVVALVGKVRGMV
jgi:hypothetical protein